MNTFHVGNKYISHLKKSKVTLELGVASLGAGLIRIKAGLAFFFCRKRI